MCNIPSGIQEKPVSWFSLNFSASVGLGGLTVREVAKGALLCEDFQPMLDPLFKVTSHYITVVCNF